MPYGCFIETIPARLKLILPSSWVTWLNWSNVFSSGEMTSHSSLKLILTLRSHYNLGTLMMYLLDWGHSCIFVTITLLFYCIDHMFRRLYVGNSFERLWH